MNSTRPLTASRTRTALIPAMRTSTLLQVVMLAGIFVLNFFVSTDPDVWWHLAAGRHIAETGAIPGTDPFSYTATQQTWIAHEWLAEVLMYVLYSGGGYLLLVVLFASLISITFFMVFRTLRLLGLTIVVATCITSWAAAMSLAGWNVRPQVFSYLFFAAYLYLLVRSRERPERRIWLLPAIMVLWVNLHAGYIMGLLIIGLFLVGEAVNKMIDPRTGPPPVGLAPEISPSGEKPAPSLPANDEGHVRRAFASASLWLPVRLLGVAAATAAATMVNPHGLAMLLYPFTYAGTQNASMRYINEWQSPDFHNYFFFVFGASIMVLMIAPKRRPVDWALSLPVLVLTAMSLQSARVIPFYALVAAPFLAISLFRPATGSRIQRPGHATPLNWPVLAICLAAFASTLFLSDQAQVGPTPRTADYPVEGVEYLRETGLEGNLFNTYHWGGFLIWSLHPERLVFIDGRADLYGDAFIDKYREVYGIGSGWDEVLEEHAVETALIEKDSALATVLSLSEEWTEVFQGEMESIFVRAQASDAAGESP